MPKESLRGAYGKTLLKLGQKNSNIVVLDADLAKSTKTIAFAQENPERFIDMGLAEQDMISTAAGLALTGKTVFASTFCVFLVGRVYDQVRQSICYNNANVKLVGTHSGLGVGEDGATHQALEDIALLRPLPNMKIIVPADALEAIQAVEYAAGTRGPVFIRLTRSNLEQLYDNHYQFQLGKGSIIKSGKDVTVVAIGAMVEKALETARLLQKDMLDAAVINLSTIKPLDQEMILSLAKKTKRVVTMEDHSVYGGLGSTIAEFLSQNQPTPMKIFGVDNQFGKSGKPDDLYHYYGLAPEIMAAKIKKFIKDN